MYERMIRAEKPAKVALTAIRPKLIELANALVRDNRKWTPKGLDQDGYSSAVAIISVSIAQVAGVSHANA